MSLRLLSTALNDKALPITAKHNAFMNFITYFDGLKTNLLGVRTFTDEQLSQQIFKRSWNQNQERMIIERHFFAAYNTLNRINAKVTAANFDQYEFLIRSLSYDLFDLVRFVEVVVLGNTLNFDMGSRSDQNAREIFDVSRTMLELGAINPANLYLREFFPVSIFLLRQAIEVYGKRTLGYHAITNEKGERVRGVSTQVAWQFIKIEIDRPTSRITLPTHVDIIKKVEEWTNAYVHTGDLPEIYLIENAIQFVWPLIYPQNTTMVNYKNNIVFAGTTQISNYNAVKVDFEAFVNQQRENGWLLKYWKQILIALRLAKKPNRKIIQWNKLDSIDATITTL